MSALHRALLLLPRIRLAVENIFLNLILLTLLPQFNVRLHISVQSLYQSPQIQVVRTPQLGTDGNKLSVTSVLGHYFEQSYPEEKIFDPIYTIVDPLFQTWARSAAEVSDHLAWRTESTLSQH